MPELGPLGHNYSRICEQCNATYVSNDYYQPESHLGELCPRCRALTMQAEADLRKFCGMRPIMSWPKEMLGVPELPKKTYDEELRRQKMQAMQAMQAGYDHATAQMRADQQSLLAQMGIQFTRD